MVALGERGGIAPTLSEPRHGTGWVVSITPWPRFTPGGEPAVSIVQEAGWAPEPLWTQGLQQKFSAFLGLQTGWQRTNILVYGVFEKLLAKRSAVSWRFFSLDLVLTDCWCIACKMFLHGLKIIHLKTWGNSYLNVQLKSKTRTP
jgi:hypothetical protein